jgi:hypothetical protein
MRAHERYSSTPNLTGLRCTGAPLPRPSDLDTDHHRRRCYADAIRGAPPSRTDNTDDALIAAAERERGAEERLLETPPEDPTVMPKAHRLYQRAEGVEALAEYAAEGAEQ